MSNEQAGDSNFFPPYPPPSTGRGGGVRKTPMFFHGMPFAAINGLNLFNKEWVIREGKEMII